MARTRLEWEEHQELAELWQWLRRIIAISFIVGITAAAFFVLQSGLAWAIAAPIPFLIGILGTYYGWKRGAGYTYVLVGLLTLAICAFAILGVFFVVLIPFWLITCATGMLMSRWFVDPVENP